MHQEGAGEAPAGGGGARSNPAEGPTRVAADRMTQALQTARRADAPSRFAAVRDLIARRDLRAAAVESTALCRDHPGFAAGWHVAAYLALQSGDAPGACELVARALALEPANAPFRLLHGQCLAAAGRPDEARTVADGLTDGLDDAAFWLALGTLRQQLNAHEAARAAYDRALVRQPDHAAALFNRATVRRFLGDLAGAEADYDRVLALRPDDDEAYLNRSELRPQDPARNHVAELEAALARCGDSGGAGEVRLSYALAKEYEDLGEYRRSFAALARGAGARRRTLAYDVARDVATVDWIIEAFSGLPPLPDPMTDAQADRTADASDNASPVFVLGLPRSGTTLVDRILSSHPQLVSAGESNAFAAAVVAAAGEGSAAGATDRRALIARSATVDFGALGRDYLGRVAREGYRARFVDKMPPNYLYCGLIARALPGATLVHVERHPMAVCYAMYKTLFRDGYPFSYSLTDLAAYYVAYVRLMAFWRRALPGRIHTVAYERLVADQRGETARLLAACALPWDEACIDFHKNPTATTTASASQVRRPLYSTSLWQWRHYEDELAGLRHALEAAGIAVGVPP